MDKILVKPGDIVSKWQKIALMWNSWNSSSPHLHFQINRLLSPLDTVNWRVYLSWYKTLLWVKTYTVDPIEFVEKNLDINFYKNWDNLIFLSEKENIETKLQSVETEVDLLTSLQKDLDKKLLETKPSAYIKKISLWLVDNEVQVGHTFTIKLTVSPWIWEIAIKPSNANLKYSPDLIRNPTKSEYTINVLAIKEWITKLTFLDGKSIREYKIKVYNPNIKVLSLQTDAKEFNLIKPTLVKVYPVDKFWNKLNIKLKWTFKVYFENKDFSTIPIEIRSDWNLQFLLTGAILGKSKLIIEWDKHVFKKNVVTHVAKDYPYNWKYASNIAYLIKLWIVKWDNWMLFPYNKLTRRQLAILLWRSVLKVNCDKAKQEMLQYMKKNGKFFKDINWKSYSDPYIFVLWKNELLNEKTDIHWQTLM